MSQVDCGDVVSMIEQGKCRNVTELQDLKSECAHTAQLAHRLQILPGKNTLEVIIWKMNWISAFQHSRALVQSTLSKIPTAFREEESDPNKVMDHVLEYALWP
jgi:hypothetical protein